MSDTAGVVGMGVVGPLVFENGPSRGPSNPGLGGDNGVGASGWVGAGGRVVTMVMTDGGYGDVRCVYAKVFSIAKCDTSRTVHSYDVLVKLSHFDNDSGLVPFGWMGTNQILQPYAISDDQWR